MPRTKYAKMKGPSPLKRDILPSELEDTDAVELEPKARPTQDTDKIDPIAKLFSTFTAAPAPLHLDELGRDVWAAQERVLHAYRGMAGTVTAAARLAGVSRETARYWLKEDVHGFKTRVEEASDEFKQNLESWMYSLIFQMRVGHNPTLLIFALKGAMPDKYRDSSKINDEEYKEILEKIRSLPGPVKSTPPVEKVVQAEGGEGPVKAVNIDQLLGLGR